MNAKEIMPDVSEQEYRDYLDEIYGEIDVCGILYDAGRLLQEIDPIAFNQGLLSHESGIDSTWQCSECDEKFDDEDEANECCAEDHVTVGQRTTI